MLVVSERHDVSRAVVAVVVIVIMVIAGVGIFLYSHSVTTNTNQSGKGAGGTTTQVYCLPFTTTVRSSTKCTATVSGDLPSGVVEWSASSNKGSVVFSQRTCTLVADSCSVSVTATPIGSLKIAASYRGNSVDAASSATYVPYLTTTTNFRGSPISIAVNSETHTVYVLNSPGTVSVIQGSSNTVVAEVDLGDGELGDIAVNPTTNMVYATNEYPGTLFAIDGSTNQVVANLSLGGGLLGIAVDAAINRIYVTNGNPVQVSVVNGSDNKVIATVPLVGTGYSHFIAVNPLTNRVYVDNGAYVNMIDGRTNRLISSFDVGCVYGIAVDPSTDIVYISCGSKVSVLNGLTNTLIGTIPGVGFSEPGVNLIGTGVSFFGSLAVNPSTGIVYVVDLGDNDALLVIDGSTRRMVHWIESTGNAGSQLGRSVAVDQVSNTVYATELDFGNVSVINGSTNRILTDIPGWGSPSALAVNPSTNAVYVTMIDSGLISVMNGSTNNIMDTISTGSPSNGIAVNPSTNIIYVTHYGKNTVSVISGSTNIVVATIAVGHSPMGVAVNPATNMVYVANLGSNSVSVIDGSKNTVIATIRMNGTPKGVATNPSTGMVYVGSDSRSEALTVINGSANEIVAYVSISGTANAVAVDASTNTIFVSGENQSADAAPHFAFIAVVNGTSKVVLKTLDFTCSACSTIFSMAVNPSTGLVYASDVNNLDVINSSTSALVLNMASVNAPGAVALNPVTGIAYVVLILDGTVLTVDWLS